MPYKFYPKNVSFEPNAKSLKKFIRKIEVEHQWTDDEGHERVVSNEAYSVDVSEVGCVSIKTVSTQGGLHAISTLSQLFYAHSDCGHDYTPYAPIFIKDSPTYEHRGILLDICRNEISPKDVMRTIDGLALSKLNRLHLHATDSQSWPIEIPSLPELALKGAYHKDQIWSVADLKEVQEYGVCRGVEVFLEISVPSHSGSIFHSFPSLVTAYNQQPWEQYAAEPPAGQLKLNSPEVPPFLTTLFNDLLPRLSTYSSHFHVGGDEFNSKVCSIDPTVKSDAKHDIRPLLQKFYDHVFSHISAHSMIPIAFEEVVLEWDLELPKSIIIQIWRDQASLASVVEKGYRALFGPCSHWYLDGGFGSWVDPNPSNAKSSVQPPFLDWCSPYKNWRQIYSYNPLADISEKHRHLVLGGEVCLWGELTDGITLDGKVWPRAAAAAEVMWTGSRKLSEDTTRRLAEMRERLVKKGIASSMVQMEWCLSNPGASLM